MLIRVKFKVIDILKFKQDEGENKYARKYIILFFPST